MASGELSFRLNDQFGRSHDVSTESQFKLVAINEKCPQKIPKLKEKNYLITISETSGREELIKKFPTQTVLLDRTDLVTQSFNLKKHGDFVIYDPINDKILNRGSVFSKKSKSCDLNYQPVKYSSFQKEIYPSLKNACLNCHANLGIISLFNSAENIQKWSPMMLRTMRLGKMPGGADLESIKTADGFTNQDLKKITYWLRAGAPVDKNDVDFIITNQRSDQEETTRIFESRKPDLVLEAQEEVTVPAVGPDFQKTYKFKNTLPDDVFITDAFVDSNLNVAHHHQLTASLTELNKEDEEEGHKYKYLDALPLDTTIDGIKKRGFLFDYKSVLGVLRQKGFVWVGSDSAKPLLEKNSWLYLNVHYVSSGREEKNKPKIYLYAKKAADSSNIKPLKKILLIPSRKDFLIPPGKKNYTVILKYKVSKPMKLIKYLMHAHYRAVSGKISIKRPGDKTASSILSIPYYQFKLPAEVRPENPLILPKGTEIESEMVFDNSGDNAANPDSEIAVKIGLSSMKSEMSYSQIIYEDMP